MMITRRYFVTGLTSCAALAVLAAKRIPKLGSPHPGIRVHCNDPIARNRDIRAFVDGREVTRSCFQFDSGEGWADCFVDLTPNAPQSKRRILDTGETAKERLYGVITTLPPLDVLARKIAEM